MPLPAVFSQRTWPGAGDVDDCWIVSTIWAACAADPGARRPSVPEFRAIAGDPDDGYLDGGSLDEVMRGARGTWPRQTLRPYLSRDWEGFVMALRRGATASLAVWSGKLPPELRFGFGRAHQIAVAFDGGGLVVANPLAPKGSRPIPISASALRVAATARELGYGGVVRAALFEEVSTVAIFTRTPTAGVFTIKAGQTVDGYSLAGAEPVIVKTWEPRTVDSSARFVAILSRTQRISPTPLLEVAEGYFAGLYVPTSQVEEAVTPRVDPTVGALAAQAARVRQAIESALG